MRPQELIYQQGPRADPGELMASRWRGREEPGPWGTVMSFTREFRGGTVGSKVWVRDAKGQWEGKEGFVSWRSGRGSLPAAGCGLTRGSGEVSCHTSRVNVRWSQGLDGGLCAPDATQDASIGLFLWLLEPCPPNHPCGSYRSEIKPWPTWVSQDGSK